MSYEADGGGGGYPRSLPSAGREIRVNHEVLKDVADQLAKNLRELEGSTRGTLRSFQNNSAVDLTGNQLGHYPAAAGTTGMDGLAGTCRNAYSTIGSVYGQFLTAYDNLINALKKTAENHSEAEQASTKAVDSAYNGASSTQTPPSSSQFYA
jgi:hypothetical protein